MSTVGCFAGGASPYGTRIWPGTWMSGARSPYKSPSLRETDGRELQDSSEERRVVRGGGFLSPREVLRCADRQRPQPPLTPGADYLGFRVRASHSNSEL